MKNMLVLTITLVFGMNHVYAETITTTTTRTNVIVTGTVPTTTGAKDAAQKAEDTANTGKKKFGLESIISLGVAGYAAYQAATCGAPGCQVPYVALSALMTMNAIKAQKAEASAKASQYSSCTTANKVSTTQTDCGVEPPVYVFPTDTVTIVKTLDPPIVIPTCKDNNRCTCSPQSSCDPLVKVLPPGIPIREVAGGLSLFASGKTPLKINSDGSISTKDGKKFDPSALNSEAAMLAAGLTPEMAKMALAQIGKTGADETVSKSTGAVAANTVFGGDESGSGGKNSPTGVAVNGDANHLEGDADKNRAIASTEGLVREFNGENIGVQDDDIFRMMKRRYLLKDKQNSFMSAGVDPATPSP